MQQPDGWWKHPGGDPAIRSRAAYDQMEIYRQLGVLVCRFGLDHHHPRNRPKGSHSDLRVGLAICRMLNAISA